MPRLRTDRYSPQGELRRVRAATRVPRPLSAPPGRRGFPWRSRDGLAYRRHFVFPSAKKGIILKVLILSCNTGQGHNTAGRAVEAELLSRGIECELRDALAFDSVLISNAVSQIHAKAAVHVPKLYGVGVKTARLMDQLTEKHSACYVANISYAKKLYHYIMENGYDTVLIPHVFPSEAMTRLRRHHAPGIENIRTYFLATDYSYPPFLHETELDTYFIPHEELRTAFEKAGVPRDKTEVMGIPVGAAFSERISKEQARMRLGLPMDKRIILIMTGSMGYGNTEALTDRLLRELPEDIHVLVMGGNNRRLKENLRMAHALDERLTVLDFTREVALYMAASDLLFTKPGGLSSTEAAVRGIPFLHTKPIPGWEEDNIRFFREHGMSDYGENTDALVTKALFLLANPHRCAEMVENQKKTVIRDAAARIVDRLASDASRFHA